MKVGRNARCPCGSGKKYKHCCLRAEPPKVGSPDFGEVIQRALSQFQAKERIRASQQGQGKPIISARLSDQQVVAVGNTIYHSSRWKTFIDFLGAYLPRKLSVEWLREEAAKSEKDRHPFMEWHEEIVRQSKVLGSSGEPKSMEVTGAIACYFGLAYSLYLLEHNVELQSRLIERLKDVRNFQGAYYELLVARALINAGFELTLEDESERGTKHCEFAAISKETGEKYWIEAKMRSGSRFLGKDDTDGVTGERASNPISRLPTHLSAALAKPADSRRMIFIDLNADMSPEIDEENPPDFVEAVNRRLLRYEAVELRDKDPAYVFVTNMTFHRYLREPAQMIGIPFGLGIDDFNRSGHLSLSEIYRRDQKHADAFRLGESVNALLRFPTTFDGSLIASGLLGERPPIQIGESYNFEGAGPHGEDIHGLVTDAVVMEKDKEVVVSVTTTDQQSYILREPMSDAQLADYKAHPDAYFGKIKAVPKQVRSPYDLFLFFMNAYAATPRAKLLELMGWSDERAKDLTDEELRIRYCEGMVVASKMFEVRDGVMTDQPAARQP